MWSLSEHEMLETDLATGSCGYFGIINVDFHVMAQVFWIRQILQKESKCYGAMHKIFTESEKVHSPVRREVLYNIVSSVEPWQKLR